ncbi:MAG TPA: MarC family protein [Limnochordia bacterium]|nr:MarC family protein [Limnochordia bacterium]
MHAILTSGFQTFFGLLAIMNPIGILPIYLAITKGENPEQRRRTQNTAAVGAFGILLAFTLLGHLILQLFGISIPAFRVAGGVLIGLIGLDMVRSSPSHLHQLTEPEHEAAVDAAQVGLVPLAMPMMAGPGAIATTLSFIGDGFNLVNGLVVIVAAALVVGLCWLSFRYSAILVRMLGQNGIGVLTRMMGLILVVIAVQMGFSGAKALWGAG